MIKRWLLLPLLLGLSACTPPQGVRSLNFQAAPEAAAVDGGQLLVGGRVPANLLLSVPEAVRRAPDGSVIVVCNRKMSLLSFWGVCTHLSRKLWPGVISDSPNIFAGGVQNRPESTLYGRDAVIVLDVGVTPEMLPRLRAEAQRLKGTPYILSDTAHGLDCTTYQNALQAALGLPELAHRNPAWQVWLPQDALTGPAMQAGGRVLWVGFGAEP